MPCNSHRLCSLEKVAGDCGVFEQQPQYRCAGLLDKCPGERHSIPECLEKKAMDLHQSAPGLTTFVSE